MACFYPDNRQAHVGHSPVEAFGKRVSCIHNQTDVVLLTELPHIVRRHGPSYPHAMMQRHLLKFAFRGVIEGRRPLFADVHSQTALRCSTEYQHHRYSFGFFPSRKRCVNVGS